MLYRGRQAGFGHYVLIIIVLVVGVAGFAGWKVYRTHTKPLAMLDSAGHPVSYDKEASRQLTNGKCSGAGAVTLGAPMPIDQIGIVLPYGVVVGGHVTPIDHQYYWGLDNRALRDTYDVLAPGDGTIVSIGHRGNRTNTPPHTVNVPSSD